MARRFWLLKSDPDTFGWSELLASPGRTTRWDGVRNYQARNLLRDELRPGDGILFYHSVVDRAVVGTAVVVRAGYPDPTQFDPGSPYHDPDSTAAAPRWYAVDVQADAPFATPVTLDAMRTRRALGGLELLRPGTRLSVIGVTPSQWDVIVQMGAAKAGSKTAPKAGSKTAAEAGSKTAAKAGSKSAPKAAPRTARAKAKASTPAAGRRRRR